LLILYFFVILGSTQNLIILVSFSEKLNLEGF